MAGTFEQCFHSVPLTEPCAKCPAGLREIFTVNQLTGYMSRHTLPDRSGEQPTQQAADEPRAIVRAFALAMERKLAANDDGKGNWHDDGEWNHLLYAEAEMDELKQAMADYRNALATMFQAAIFPTEEMTPDGMASARATVGQAKVRMLEARQAVLDEAADVANYLMFACDVIGALPPTDERGR